MLSLDPISPISAGSPNTAQHFATRKTNEPGRSEALREKRGTASALFQYRSLKPFVQSKLRFALCERNIPISLAGARRQGCAADQRLQAAIASS